METANPMFEEGNFTSHEYDEPIRVPQSNDYLEPVRAPLVSYDNPSGGKITYDNAGGDLPDNLYTMASTGNPHVQYDMASQAAAGAAKGKRASNPIAGAYYSKASQGQSDTDLYANPEPAPHAEYDMASSRQTGGNIYDNASSKGVVYDTASASKGAKTGNKAAPMYDAASSGAQSVIYDSAAAAQFDNSIYDNTSKSGGLYDTATGAKAGNAPARAGKAAPSVVYDTASAVGKPGVIYDNSGPKRVSRAGDALYDNALSQPKDAIYDNSAPSHDALYDNAEPLVSFGFDEPAGGYLEVTK